MLYLYYTSLYLYVLILICDLPLEAEWQAASSAFFEGWSIGDVRRLGGVTVSNQVGAWILKSFSL